MENPFNHKDPVIPPIFAGRSKELAYINNALFTEKESLILYGNDAIGKSSIVSTLYMTLNASKMKLFPVRINAFDFIRAIEDNFLGITTHQICAAIWTKLMGRSYSELIEDGLTNSKGLKSGSAEEKTIKRIFRIVTSEKFTATGTIDKELGADYIIKGSVSQKSEIINERKKLAPFEFLHLLDELIDIIKQYNYNSIIVFCDELNHFPEIINVDILRNYLSVFSSNKIQFVIVAVNPEQRSKDDAEKLIQSFNCKLEIGTFKLISDVEELISNSLSTLNDKYYFQSGAAEYLFNSTEGHPWWIQKLSNNSFNEINESKEKEISLQSLEKSFLMFEGEIKVYKERIAAGLPFRKFFLSSFK